MSAGALGRGIEIYKEAWKELQQSGSTAMLAAPRLLAYRPPPSSVKRSRLDADESEERFTVVKFTILQDGRTDDVQLVEGDATESAQRSVVSAMKKARYSPRFENGEPVATPEFTHRERLLVKVKQAADES
jgi:TonB family protein